MTRLYSTPGRYVDRGNSIKLGRCCVCDQREDESVRNIVTLNKRSPEAGIGCWGCLVCGLPQAGAVAVVCDECMKNFTEPRFIVLGRPGDNRRLSYAQLAAEEFDHDMSKHQEDLT